MVGYLYSSCFGSFVFDKDFKLKDKTLFKDILKSNSDLESNKWLEEEKQLIKKHNPEFFIGIKEQKLEGIKLTQDPTKMASIQQFFKKDFSNLYQTNLMITKQKLKQAVTEDQLIIQTINNIDDLNKTTNTLVKRLREWYELYNPEFSESIQDHEKFVELIIKKDKGQLLKELKLKPEQTMGADLKEKDVKPIIALAKQINDSYKLKDVQTKYLEEKMNIVCPNMNAITGALIGAKLMSLAGSLQRMAELPSSTIQLLGAEKALFRHLTNKKSLPPKYGVLHEHPLITKAKKKDHGKIARKLADKISLAVKVDYFKGEFIGDKLKRDLEKRFGR